MAAIVVGTNSYVTEAELSTYATDRGITISAVDTTVLLIKAMDYIETRNFKGSKYLETQTLEFPRDFTKDGTLPDGTVPDDIKNAQMVAALIIDSGAEVQETLSQTVKREKVASIEVEYMDNSTGSIYYQKLNDWLRPYIESTLRAVRV